MAHNNYLVYFDSEDSSPEGGLRLLKEQFGNGNVEQLNSSTTYAIKVDAGMTFTEIQRKVGFNADNPNNIRGVIVQMCPGYHNGWFSRSFWDFLQSTPGPLEENKTSLGSG